MYFIRNYNIITEDGVTILRLECTTLEDNAIFSCTVANSFGMQTATCKVIVEDDVLEHKRIGTHVICDREDSSGQVDAVVLSPHKSVSTFTFSSSEVVEKTEETQEATEQSSMKAIDGQQPFFLLPLEDGDFKGNTCTLKCIIMATPTAQVVWLIEEQIVTEDETTLDNGVAQLQILVSNSSHDIHCFARNSKGKAESRCVITKIPVEQEESTLLWQKPYFIHPLHDQVTEKNSLTLRVVVVASPAATLQWSIDGENVIEESDKSVINEDGIGILTMQDLKKGATYVSCVAKNDYGICTTNAIVTKVPESDSIKITRKQ
ncbi:immunoglobulin I-set domain protein, partial [Teladorsagia circumcincta]